MNPLKHLSLALLFTLQIACSSSIARVQASQTASPARALLDGFLDSLNSGDDAKLRTFLEKYGSSDVPIDQRMNRLKGLRDQGAPFKKVKDGEETETLVSEIVEDKNGMRLEFAIMLKKTPDLKIVGLRVQPPNEGGPPKDYSAWKSLDGLAKSIAEDSKSPAAAIAVLHEGKLETAVTGVRKLGGSDSVGPDEPFSIGSIGKPICSTIIGKLVEMGKLRWETTLGEALSDLPMKPEYKPVTIEQIMHHRGGIPEDGGFRRPEVVRILTGATEPVKMRENYAKDILSREPIAKPDERFAYSNAGYALLSVIAERAVKQPYEHLVRSLVFEPLGLKHSYTADDTLPADRPSGHMDGPNGLEPQDMGGPMERMFAGAGGGLYMSVGDLARFGEAHLKGLRGEDGLLKASTVKRLHEGVPEMEPEGRRYACGWGIEAHEGIETMHMHNGSNGTMRAQLSIFPEHNLVVAAFINRGGESEPSPPMQAVMAIAGRYARTK